MTYKRKMEIIIGNDTSPIGPGVPTFPGLEDSPPSPGKNGSFQGSAALISPTEGIIRAEDSRVVAMDRFSLLRYDVEGNSLLSEITGVSVSAHTDTVGTTIKAENNIKVNSICSFVFIIKYIFSRVCVFNPLLSYSIIVLCISQLFV